MQRAFKGLLTGMLLMAVVPVQAQSGTDEQTFVLPLSAQLAATDASDTELNVNEMARVLTSMGRPAECLAAIVVNKIDGEERVVSALGFLIEPGVHTINGKAILDMTNCPLIDSNPVINTAEDLEVDFEPGATYHIGYFHAPANTQEWKLVVWHIEKSPQD
jgi:hypothetical protein